MKRFSNQEPREDGRLVFPGEPSPAILESLPASHEYEVGIVSQEQPLTLSFELRTSSRRGVG